MDDNHRLMDALSTLLADSFPHIQFPPVQYEEKLENDGKILYFARIKLLGQVFCSGPQISKEEALKTVCSVACEVITEFKRIVSLETNLSLGCESLSKMFGSLNEEANQVARNVTQEALRSVSTINNRLIEVENEKINHKVKAKNEKIIEKMQTSIHLDIPEPAKVAKIELNSERKSESMLDNNQETEKSENIQQPEPSESYANIRFSPLKISDDPSKVNANIGAPIPAFYEYVEKQSSTDPIIFDDFVKGPNFGCRLRWGKRFWVAPAEHRQKKDAHNLAAVMACIELFGEGFTFEGVDPRIYFKWTRESVRKNSDKYSFATSDELLANGKNESFESVDMSKLKVEPFADGRKFMSVINEICQKMRFTPPNYQVSSVNALTNYYVCTVRNFHDLPQIESLPFTKKNEAKEDAASKIYYILKQKGIVDEASRVIGRQKSLEMANTNREQHRESPFSGPLGSQSDPVSAPPTSPLMPQQNMNMNMMQMMPMFMMAQMSQPQQMQGSAPFDPQMMQNFENMMKQWQAFLAWQQQQGLNGSGQLQTMQNELNHRHQYSQGQAPSYNQQSRQNQNQSYRGPQSGQYANNRNNHPDERNESRYSREEDRCPSDNYSRKRNYEESRRRYYE